MADAPHRSEIVTQIGRTLNARASENEELYRRELEQAVVEIFRDIPATPEALASETTRRLYETLDLLIASIDFLAVSIEKHFGVPRYKTTDLLETILNEQIAASEEEG